MFSLPSSERPPRGGAPLRGLPLATVVTLAGVVLLLGRTGAGIEGGTDVVAGEVVLATMDTAPLRGAQRLDGEAPRASDPFAVPAPGDRQPQAGGDTDSPPLPSSEGGEVDRIAAGDGRQTGTLGLDPGSGSGLPGLEGLRAEGPFHLGARHGEWTFFDPQGYVQEVGAYRSGRRDGAWRRYARNGQMIQLAEYVSGTQEGLWQRFSREGSLLEEGRYEASAPHGRWIRRYSDGSIKERGLYEAGLREGPWEFYDDLGRPTLRTGVYRAGIRVD